MRSGPQAAAPLAGLCFRRVEFVVPVIRGVAPSVTVANLFEVDEAIAEIDSSHLASVAVDIDDLDADGLSKNFVGEILFRLLAKGLRLFGRVDAEEADAVLQVGIVQNRERVAVGDRDDPSDDDIACEGAARCGAVAFRVVVESEMRQAMTRIAKMPSRRPMIEDSFRWEMYRASLRPQCGSSERG